MKPIAILFLSLFVQHLPLSAFDQSHYPPLGTIPIILDTDMGTDIDDVGALAIMHAFADAGVCRIIAIGVDSPEPYSACCADAINTYYQRPDIPIGIVKNGPATPTSQFYSKPITQQFPNDLKNSINNIPDAVVVYRRALAQEADSSVVIVAIGYKTIFSQLLKSIADTISPLNGTGLVKKKVKLWVDMGGQYPSGHEWNFYCDGAAAQYAVANWPTPVVFTGFEIGDPIKSGSTLSSMVPASSPVRKAYEIVLGVGGSRSSWDLTAVLYACRGLKDYWNIHGTGYNSVDNSGNNQWVEQNLPGVDHSYLVAKMSNASIGQVLDSLLVLPPRGDPITSVAARASSSGAIQQSAKKASLVIPRDRRRGLVYQRGDGVSSPKFYDIKGRMIIKGR